MAEQRLHERNQWPSDAIDRQRAHQEVNPVRRDDADAAELWTERVAMMQSWADYLDSLGVQGQVVPLTSHRHG